MEQGIPPNAPTLAGPVGAFAKPGIDAVLLLLPPADGLRFLQEVRRQNLHAPLLGDLPLAPAGTLAQAGEDAEGFRCQLDFLPDPPPDQPAMTSFATRYRNAFHIAPDSPAASGYTAVGLLAAAITRLGHPAPSGLITALKGLHLKAGTPAILADTTIDPSGEMTRPTFLIELHPGTSTLLATLA